MYELISLNIQGNRIEQLSIDGPALRLRLQGEATRWFPLRRIRHLCITGELNSSTETLLKLAQKRILITLFSSCGKLQCQIFHPLNETPQLVHLIDECANDLALASARNNWYENALLQSFAYTGFNRGCSKLAIKSFRKNLSIILRTKQIRPQFKTVNLWMSGIAQVAIVRLFCEKTIPLFGRERNRLRRQLAEISRPLVQQASLYWIVQNPDIDPSPARLAYDMGKFEHHLTPWLSRCINELELALEQASFTPTVEQTRRTG